MATHRGKYFPFFTPKNIRLFILRICFQQLPTSLYCGISAYDLDPVKVMEEKGEFLKEVTEKNYILFFEHDYYTECASVQETEKGILLNEKFSLAELG